MNISNENKELLTFLSNWNSELYDFSKLHDLELDDQFSKFNDIDIVLGCDVPKHILDEFYAFASSGDGGTYCLWFYPDLQGEAPVVFAGMEGERCTVASSFKEFAFLLTQRKVLDTVSLDFQNDGTESPWIDFEEYYDAEELGLNSIQVQESIANFEYQLSQIFNLEEVSTNHHPNFAEWIENNKETVNQKSEAIDVSDIALESGRRISPELIEAVQNEKLTIAIKIFRNLNPGTGVGDGRDAYREISTKLGH